jgi:hypothetical protein
MVKNYNSKVSSELKKQGLFDALTTLQAQAQQGWSPELETEFNRIKGAQYKIRKDVELKIRHLRMGAVEWSPKLQSYSTAIEIWSLLLKKRKGTWNISNCKLRWLLCSSDIKDAYSKTIPEIEDALTKAFDDYKTARNQASTWRDEFLASLAKSRAEKKGTTAEAKLKQLQSIAKQKRLARNIKRMQGKLQRNATVQIVVNDEHGRRVVTEKQEMEEACIEENIARFSQSQDTPPMMEPLVDQLGYLADTTEAEEILQGTYQPPEGTNYYARLFL